MSKQYYMII